MEIGPDDALRLDQQICFPLYAASNLMTRLYRPLLTELGLTYPQYLVMLVLWETSPIRMGELCQRLYLDSGTLTPLLKRLASTGYLSRERDPGDERRVVLALTPAGLALKQRALSVPIALASQFDGEPEQVTAFRIALQSVTQDLADKVAALAG
jgi:MarR family transcriptional regulator, organic hydroperoxide resistance regulator